MPLCKRKSRSEPAQKVVIPRGMINPGETTIIEIPAKLHREPVVVAKRKPPEYVPSYNRSPSPSTSRRSSSPPPTPIYSPQSSFQPTYYSTPQKYSSATAANDNADLDATEKRERLQLQRDLEEFQRARRKLLANASHMASKNPNSIESHYGADY